jgi:hypothetical protein
MKGAFSAAQILAIFSAIRRTNFSDSMTHGPRMKAGFPPPMVTFLMRSTSVLMRQD